jgi:hypothetical protein
METSDIEKISFLEDPLTIVFSLCRFSGREVNVVELYELFKTILLKGTNFQLSKEESRNLKPELAPKLNLSESEIRAMFTSALSQLKYMGFLSQTR